MYGNKLLLRDEQHSLLIYLFLKKTGGCSPPLFLPLCTKIKLTYTQRSIPKTAKSKHTQRRALVLQHFLPTPWFCYQQEQQAIKEKLLIFLTSIRDSAQETIKADRYHQNMLSSSHAQEEKWLWVLHHFFFWYYRCENTTNLNALRTHTENSLCIVNCSFLETK